MFPSTSSRETSGLLGNKTNCFPRDHTLSVYYYMASVIVADITRALIG